MKENIRRGGINLRTEVHKIIPDGNDQGLEEEKSEISQKPVPIGKSAKRCIFEEFVIKRCSFTPKTST